MKPADGAARAPARGIRTLAILIGLLLVPAMSLWVAALEEVHGIRATYLSVFFHAVLLLVVLTGLNAVFRLIAPALALSRAELLVVYTMIGVSSGIVGDQFIAILVPSLAHPFRYATEGNLWEARIWPHLPHWAMVSDPVAVRRFYEGTSTLYAAANLRPWIGPAAIWAGFIAATQLMCLAVNVLMRRQWTDYEKLSFPLTRLPLEITAPGPQSIWRSRRMWCGFGLAALIGIVNGLRVRWPAIPGIGVKYRWLAFPGRWEGALTSTAASFYPFVIGIAYFLPSDLTFATWFFFLLFRLERVICVTLGYPASYPWQTAARSDPPAMLEQGIGAYIAVVVFALWTARRHLRWAWRAVWSRPGGAADALEARFNAAELTEYRVALVAIAVGLIATTWFARGLGMPVLTGFAYLLLYLVINTAIAKIRAEAGAPTHGFHFAGPDHVLLTVLGTKGMPVRQMAAWGLLFGFNRAYTGVPMPHQLEGMKIGELVGAERHRLSAAQALAVVIGSLAAFWALLHLCYREGAEQMQHPVALLSGQGWTMVNSWIEQPTDPNWLGFGAIVFGFLFASWLMWMRFRFVWWPFHPIGYAIAPDWTVGLIWMPLMVGWAAKCLVMHYGGPKVYQAGVPFALGLVLGDFLVGGFWALLAMITREPQYSFWP